MGYFIPEVSCLTLPDGYVIQVVHEFIAMMAGGRGSAATVQRSTKATVQNNFKTSRFRLFGTVTYYHVTTKHPRKKQASDMFGCCCETLP